MTKGKNRKDLKDEEVNQQIDRKINKAFTRIVEMKRLYFRN